MAAAAWASVPAPEPGAASLARTRLLSDERDKAEEDAEQDANEDGADERWSGSAAVQRGQRLLAFVGGAVLLGYWRARRRTTTHRAD